MAVNFEIQPVPNFEQDSRRAKRVIDQNFKALQDRISRAIISNELIRDESKYLVKDGSRLLTGNWVNGDDYGIQIPWLQLSTSFTDGIVEGRLQWNSEDGTMEYGLPGGSVVLQVGQEIVFKATNKTGSLISNGDVVYINGAQGNRPTIALARADSPLTIAVAGMATEDIANNASGYVTATGLVRDVDTSSFSDGDLMYLSPTVAGAIQVGRPTAPNYKVFIGYVTNANATGTVIVNPIIQPTMMALSDVLEAAPADGNILAWVAANSRFELTTPSSGGGVSFLTTGTIGFVWAGGSPIRIS